MPSTQKIPCTFDLEVPGLGFLDGNPGDEVRAFFLCPSSSSRLQPHFHFHHSGLTVDRHRFPVPSVRSRPALASICRYGSPRCCQSGTLLLLLLLSYVG